MKDEQLQKATENRSNVDYVKRQLHKIAIVGDKEAYFSIGGESIAVPSELKLPILSMLSGHYTNRLGTLEKEFNDI